MDFRDFNFHDTIMEAVSFMGFKKPTAIQEQAIPFILEGKDLIACAQTGTGKTAAYLLPVLDRLSENKRHDQINTLVIAPTRELAQQIDQQLEGLSYFIGVSHISVYGGGDGEAWEVQKKALSQGADIIIATPGKLLSHLNLGYVKVDQLQFLILDEADKMLDMGFYEDIMRIIQYLPKERQTLMFSATMPPKIRQLAKKVLVEPEEINIALSKPAEGVLQTAYLVYSRQKDKLLAHLLRGKELPSVLVFVSTKSKVKELERTLKQEGFAAKAIHSDLEQAERETVLREFKNRRLQVLVATDVLSRGIDIESVSLVVNYDVPHDAEDYVHRVGRTARAEKTGIAITFINEEEHHKFHRIEQLIGREVNKTPLPEFLGESPAYDPKKRVFSRGRGGGGGRPFQKSGRQGRRR